MQPTYPYLPGTVENDWRNVIYGSTSGSVPSNSIGVDGNYFVDIATSTVWGPKSSSAWPTPGVSLIHDANTIFGATNGSAPSNTLGINGDYFVDYQTSLVFGPKASGAWPGTPVAILSGPANTIFGNSGGSPPSNSVGLNGYYYFDVSTSQWYGPKASGAWPITPVPVAGGVNTIFGATSGAPTNDIGLVGSYFYDTVSQLYYGPKIISGWPSTGHLLQPVNDSNTVSGAVSGSAPASSIGVDGEFFVDGDTGKIWGPKSAGAWPGTARYIPFVAGGGGGDVDSDGDTLTGNSGGVAPSNSLGINGDYFFDTSSGSVFGPKAGGIWPPTAVWVGFRPSTGISQGNWPVFTRVRGLIVSLSDINIWDHLTVNKIFGAATDLSITTTVDDTAALGGNKVSTVGFDGDKTFLGPWGAINTTAMPMALGQVWQVVDADFLKGIRPDYATGILADNTADLAALTAASQSPWGVIPKRASGLRLSTAGYPVSMVYATNTSSLFMNDASPGGYIVSGGGPKYNDLAMVGITLMRLS